MKLFLKEAHNTYYDTFVSVFSPHSHPRHQQCTSYFLMLMSERIHTVMCRNLGQVPPDLPWEAIKAQIVAPGSDQPIYVCVPHTRLL